MVGMCEKNKEGMMSERKTFSVRLQPETMKGIKLLAVEEEKVLSELLEEAIEDLMKKYGKVKKVKMKK